MNLGQFVTNVRIWLDDPEPQHPSRRQLVKIIATEIQQFVNQYSNTAEPYSILSWPLVTGPHVEDYLVGAPNLGKILYIVTADDGDPYHFEREVRLVEPANIDQFYWGPKLAISSIQHSAQLFAPYRKPDGSFWLKIRPVPSRGDNYIVFYQTGRWELASQSSEPLVPEFHELIELHAAVNALPYARWVGLTGDGASGKAAGLGQTLAMQAGRWDTQWDRYRTNLRKESIRSRSGYADYYDSNYLDTIYF